MHRQKAIPPAFTCGKSHLIYASSAAFGGCAPKCACGRSLYTREAWGGVVRPAANQNKSIACGDRTLILMPSPYERGGRRG